MDLTVRMKTPGFLRPPYARRCNCTLASSQEVDRMSSRSQREWQSMQAPCGLAPGRRRPRLLGRQPAGRPAAKVPREGRGARTTRWPHSAAPRRTRAGGVSASELAGAPTAACPPGEQGTRRPERHSSFFLHVGDLCSTYDVPQPNASERGPTLIYILSYPTSVRTVPRQ